MKALDEVLRLAAGERLYPASILHGADAAARRAAAVEVARALLCEAEDGRPCGACRPCRRLTWPDATSQSFHPDFHVLERDLKTATSAEATKRFLHDAYSAPFEARGQVFVVAEADTLSGEAADALLKLLEEPPTRTPRHFLLLAASRLDLLPTLRSRSLSVFLGGGDSLDEATVARLAEGFGGAVGHYLAGRSSIHLLSAAEALAAAEGWEDPRARKPWATAAAAVVRHLETTAALPAPRRALLDLAEALIDAPRLRLRGIGHGRILEGLVSRHLAGL